ncbi:hypothetical protein [Bifidobacterium olomucense]|uniref:Phage protein n=1 Tax=Bifidobacterium olomucense TaxID=2675324 RepID=A0A7Y0HWY3_9BIFI|nr:hypothetical protein [Bifidobacterium sp. DSM 109959]NMM98148.1 phage protein [Bifidobacterium sp. DSM 109959]
MAADLAAMTVSVEELRAKLVNQYVSTARIMWDSLTPSDWWNDAVTTGSAAYLALIETRMIAQVRRLGISYADATLRQMGVTPSGQVDTGIYPRANTDPWLVAARPADTYRSLSSKTPDVRPSAWPDEGDGFYDTVQQWLDAAYQRLELTADTDAHAAQTSATIDRYRGSKVLEYRRVIHPELSKTGSCGLCIVAADRWYSTSNLLPLHDRCKCGVAPAGADYDPGFELNNRDLQDIYDAAGGRKAKDLVNVRVQTVTHGELGPILQKADVKPRDDSEISAKEWRTPDRQLTRQQIRQQIDRAIEFGRRYRQVDETLEPVTFRYGGRKYTFKPSPHNDQARQYMSLYVKALRAQLGEAA